MGYPIWTPAAVPEEKRVSFFSGSLSFQTDVDILGTQMPLYQTALHAHLGNWID